jgi:hypothetical protein
MLQVIRVGLPHQKQTASSALRRRRRRRRRRLQSRWHRRSRTRDSTSRPPTVRRRPCCCRQIRVIQVREDREIDDPQRLVRAGGRLPDDEVLTDPRCHRHAPGAQSDPHRVVQRRHEVCQPGLPHPVGQIQRIAAVHEQDVGLLEQRNPEALVEAGQRGELEYAHRLPPQLGHRAARLLPADEPPRPAEPARGAPVRSGGDAQRAGLGNRLAEQIDQRVVDARVGDAGGSEKKFHHALTFDPTETTTPVRSPGCAQAPAHLNVPPASSKGCVRSTATTDLRDSEVNG